MADDLFSGLQSGLQDLLPNKLTYAPPEQIKAIRGMGDEMSNQKRAPGPFTGWNALDTVVGDVLGGYMRRRAGELEQAGLEKGAAALTTGGGDSSGGGDSADASSGGDSSGGDSSGGDSSAAAPASQSSSSDQAASTSGGGDTAMAASGDSPSWVTHAANMSSEYETGAKDPMVGIRNISPDTSNPNGSPSYSYGNFGINSKAGNSAWDFWKDHGKELGLTAKPGTAEANQQWTSGTSDPQMAPKYRAAEIDWYNKSIASKIPQKLEDAGVPDSIAKDPRVLSWFADRSVQHGIGTINGRHQDRVQNAVTLSGGDPQKFINIMSTADKGNIGGDFQSRLKDAKTPEERQQLVHGLINRVSRRQGGALGYTPSAPGATPSGAPGAAPSPGAIGPMVNALAGIGGRPTPAASVPGASISANPNAPGSFDTPVSTNMMGTLRGIGAPPTGGLASDQQAIVAAMKGGPTAGAIGGAPGAPPAAPPPGAAPPMAAPPGAPGTAAMTRAIAGSQAPAAGSASLPPTLPMSSLPSDAQIQKLMASGRPEFIEQGKALAEYKRKALTPQQVSTPDGANYIGTPYTRWVKSPIPGMPQFIKSPYKVPGAYEGEQFSTLGTAPGGGFAFNPVPTNPPPGAPGGPGGAPGAAAPGGAPTAGGIPPMPSTSDPAAMANWGTQVSAARKAAEATSEEVAKGAAKPMTEAMEKASTTPDMIRKLDIMSNAYKQAGISGGPLGPAFLEMKGVAAQLGLIDPKDKALSAQNIIDKVSTQLAFQATKELTNRPAASEVLMQLKATPGMRMSNQSAIYMLDLMKQSALQDQKIGQMAMQPGMTPSRFAEMRDNYYRDNPLISPFTHRPINESGGGLPGHKNGPMLRPEAPLSATPGAPAGPAPMRVSSPAEAAKLPPGTQIQLPDGTLGRVPGG